jgi:hypothetical protein
MKLTLLVLACLFVAGCVAAGGAGSDNNRHSGFYGVIEGGETR